MNKLKTIIGKEYPNVACELIEAAKSSIKIFVFDWRWYPNDIGSAAQKLNSCIIRARQRGLEIKAITPVASTVQRLREQGINAKSIDTGKLCHVKMLIIDDKHVIIGSHNFTQNAFSRNIEMSVLIEDCEMIDNFTSFFNNLY